MSDREYDLASKQFYWSTRENKRVKKITLARLYTEEDVFLKDAIADILAIIKRYNS